MTHVNTAHRGARIAAALVAVILGATACSNDHDDASSATDLNAASPDEKSPAEVGGDGGQVAPADSDTPAAEAPTGPPGHGPGISDLPLVLPAENKNLAIDVSYGVEVGDISKGINDVVALSDRHGGQIYERTINITDDRSSTASFVIKLPPDQVESAIADLDAIGIRRTASQGTEDVTSQVVDIDARLVTAQASVERVRKLLEASTDLGQILSLESQLTERETLVEQYTAMKRALGDRVALATLRVQLNLSPEPVAAAAEPKTTEKPSVGKAFKSGWNGFVKVLAAILIFIGYTAPFLVIAAIGAAIVIPFSRRRRQLMAQARQSRSAAPPPPPAPGAGQQTSERDSVGAARSQ